MNKVQPKPKINHRPYSWNLVIKDMKTRDDFGFNKYKTHLQPFNGRDQLQDIYEELLDTVVYMRTLLYERENQNHKRTSGSK